MAITAPYLHDYNNSGADLLPNTALFATESGVPTTAEEKFTFRADGSVWGSILKPNGTLYHYRKGGTGTVTSIGLSTNDTSIFTITNSPITGSGVLDISFDSQTANTLLAAPDGADGVPVFRGLVTNDFTTLPSLSDWDSPTSNLDFNNFTIVNLPNPTNTTSPATKAYVDSVAQGYTWKEEVKGVATTPITLSGEQVIEEVSYVTGDRILPTANGTDNGIWIVDSGAWTRAADMNESSEFVASKVPVENSTDIWTSLANSSFVMDTDIPTFSKGVSGADISAEGSLYKPSLSSVGINVDDVTIQEKDFSGTIKLGIKGTTTNGQVLISDGSDYATWGQLDIGNTATVSGILPIANGGTAGTTVNEAQQNLSLLPGVNILAYSDRLQSLATYAFDDGDILFWNGTSSQIEGADHIVGGEGW